MNQSKLMPLSRSRTNGLFKNDIGLMNSKKQIIIFHLSILILLSGCGGTICKGKKHSVVFDYDPIFKTVDVGGAPTDFKGKNAPWVKKIIVKPEGFLVVNEQKTVSLKMLPCDDKNKKNQLCEKHITSSYYTMQSYTKEEGYKYWEEIQKKTGFISPTWKINLHKNQIYM